MARSNKIKTRKPSKKSSTDSNKSHLSMQQEARNTEGRSLWRTRVQLRHQTVQFVSAGNLEPAQESSLEEDAQQGRQQLDHAIVMKPLQNGTSETTLNRRPYANTANSNEELTSPMLVPGLCPIGNESSDDEVVFQGRRRIEYTPNPFTILIDANDETDTDIPGSIHIPTSSRTDGMLADRSSPENLPSYVEIDGFEYKSTQSSDEDDILADYIANIDVDYEDDNSSLSSCQHQMIEADGPTNTAENLKTALSPTIRSDAEDTPSDDIEKLPDLEQTQDSPCVPPSQPQFNQNARKSAFAPKNTFLDALELDPYPEIDIMDFSRPSLRKKTKGKHRALDLEFLDTEFATELANAWNNDRSRKKIKKQEREALRSQGLLGRREDDPDLKTKYTAGIGLEDLKSEIRLFLLSPKNSLSLPPMTKHRRILIHDMANALRLNSQSRGKGSSRFPILSKTSRTPKYTHKTISQTDRIFSRERFSSRAIKAWDKTINRQGNANRGNTSVSYMDGDVVGASAPEIGAENKGRAMLEKMGWSMGTALGATHNKGILLPVRHVVKNSKAGLG